MLQCGRVKTFCKSPPPPPRPHLPKTTTTTTKWPTRSSAPPHYYCYMTCAITLARGCCARIKGGLDSRGVGSPRGHRRQPGVVHHFPPTSHKRDVRWVKDESPNRSTAQATLPLKTCCCFQPEMRRQELFRL